MNPELSPQIGLMLKKNVTHLETHPYLEQAAENQNFAWQLFIFLYELHFVALNSACKKRCCSLQKFNREPRRKAVCLLMPIFLEVHAQTEGTKKGQKKPGRLAHHCQHSCLYKACFGSFTVMCSILKRVAVKRNSFQHIVVPFHDPQLPSTFFSSQFWFHRRN